jgi:uncharacterized protein
MRTIITRLFELRLPRGKSAFVWGPRRTGKSYWLRHNLPDSPYVDLLKTDAYAEYAARPALLRERFHRHRGAPVIIDEVQKVPALLDEVHWLIENGGPAFVLTGSSACKLRRGHANLLAGRAWRRQMAPLSKREVRGFDLERAMNSGLLPPHFLSEDPIEDLRAYISDYLKEEIATEAAARNIPAFADFLRVAAITSSELLNHANVARECGVSAKVVRTYFQILEDTFIGYRLSPWTKAHGRRLIETEKHYLFDVGVANFLARRGPVRRASAEFGKSFEHYILMELRAYQAYRDPELALAFWRTASGYEVDFIVGDMQIAIEVKASSRVHEGDLRSLRALKEDHKVRRCVVVSLEPEPRRIGGGVEVLPYDHFIDTLWDGALGL